MIGLETLFEFDDPTERLEGLLPRIEPEVALILERAVAGYEIGEKEGIALSEVEGMELAALVATADHLRQKKVGDVITYVVCRNINFTNVCYVGCKFCAFSTGPNRPDAWDYSLDEVGRRAEEPGYSFLRPGRDGQDHRSGPPHPGRRNEYPGTP